MCQGPFTVGAGSPIFSATPLTAASPGFVGVVLQPHCDATCSGIAPAPANRGARAAVPPLLPEPTGSGFSAFGGPSLLQIQAQTRHCLLECPLTGPSLPASSRYVAQAPGLVLTPLSSLAGTPTPFRSVPSAAQHLPTISPSPVSVRGAKRRAVQSLLSAGSADFNLVPSTTQGFSTKKTGNSWPTASLPRANPRQAQALHSPWRPGAGTKRSALEKAALSLIQEMTTAQERDSARPAKMAKCSPWGREDGFDARSRCLKETAKLLIREMEKEQRAARNQAGVGYTAGKSLSALETTNNKMVGLGVESPDESSTKSRLPPLQLSQTASRSLGSSETIDAPEAPRAAREEAREAWPKLFGCLLIPAKNTTGHGES